MRLDRDHLGASVRQPDPGQQGGDCVLPNCALARSSLSLSVSVSLSLHTQITYVDVRRRLRSCCRKEWQQSPARESSVDDYTIVYNTIPYNVHIRRFYRKGRRARLGTCTPRKK